MNVAFSTAKLFFNGKTTTEYKKYGKLFIDYTGLNKREVRSMLDEHIAISKLPTNRIESNLKLCKKFNIDMCSVKNNIDFLYLNEEELKYRLMILKEMGAKYITTSVIHSMANITPVALFKAFSRVPEEVYVAEIMYSYLHERPSDDLSKTLNESMTVYTYRQKCVKHYLRWRFQDFKVDDRILHDSTRSLMYKPLSEIEHAFDVLYYNAKMPIKTIWEYQCLAKCSGSDLERILDDIQTICNVPIEELLNISPALHKMKYKNVSCIKENLEALNITSEQIKNCPEVLLREAEDFLKIWTTSTEVPELRILLNHPKILRIFTLYEGFHERLRYLHYVNLQSPTVDILILDRHNFDRLVKVGAFKNRLREVSIILSCYLKRKSVHIEQMLVQHPHWRHVNLLNMVNTLCYLQTKFNDADIASNFHAILYPKNKVDNVLKNLFQQNEMMEASSRYTPSQILALCIYEIEKKFYFTGDGIWENSDPHKSLSILDEADHNTAESEWNCNPNPF